MEISSGHHQVMSNYSLNEVLPVLGYPKPVPPLSQETKPRPQPAAQPQLEPLRCPRCDSGNTKFCYYNNYSLTQPRYFCKSCRRYWTKGGTLRNVPVGGGCRKNKRSSFSSPCSSSSPVSASSKKPAQPQHNFSHDPNDFPLAFSGALQTDAFLLGNPNPGGALGFLDILRGGNPAVGGLQGTLHYFGGGNNGVMLPFSNSGEVSVGNSAIMAAETSNAGANSGHGSYWNGFVNGFPHEIHDGV